MLQIYHQECGLEQLQQLNDCGPPLQWTSMRQTGDWKSMYAALTDGVFQLNQPMDLGTVLTFPIIIELQLFLIHFVIALFCFINDFHCI
jgi:hypothetical protein